MLLKPAGLLHRGPEFCHALKFVIKLQISTLLQQLAESGEESVVLTANVLEGTADHLGSLRGAGFLDDQEQLQKQFLSYCTETRRLSVDEDGEHTTPASTYGESNLLSPSQTCSPLSTTGLYHRGVAVRPHYERESSTSDSVFSPNRRKSSASSKSLDEEMSLMSSQDYSDTPRSFSESSGTWPDLSSIASVDLSDKGTKYVTPTRSPTSRQMGTDNRPESVERMKHVSKSPMTESVESIKHINLSSPTDTQYKRLSQPSTAAVPFFAPPPLTSSIQLSAPPKVIHYGNTSPHVNSIPFSSSKSNILDTSGRAAAGTPTNRDQERDLSNESPVNLAGSSPKVGFNMTPMVAFHAGTDSGLESPFQAYKGPFLNYGDIELKPATSEVDASGTMFKLKFEVEDVEKYKSGYEMMARQAEGQYSSGEADSYRVQKKAETKIYHRHGSSGRKQPKSCIERRASDTMMVHSQDGHGCLSSSPYPHTKDKDHVMSPEPGGPKLVDVGSHFQDVSVSFEEAVKVQHSIFHSSLGLLSPLQRQFLPPTGRPLINRERSQSLSEFHTVMSPDILASGRSRFPSSSFAENLDTPLIIDDEIKAESGSVEGLDLSNKKRKMSVDDAQPMTQDDVSDSSPGNVPANHSEETEFDRLSTGARLVEDQSTKKYGKGNFIKVATGYQCRICCRVIRHMNNTTAHMRIHANVKPYKCQVCNQQFKYEPGTTTPEDSSDEEEKEKMEEDKQM